MENWGRPDAVLLETYVLSIAISIKYDCKYNIDVLKGPILGDDKEGLFVVQQNRFKRLHSKGMHCNSHNVMSISETVKLYSSLC